MACSCQNNPNSFCYICGEVVLKSDGKPLPKLVNSWEMLTNCTAAVRSEMKIKCGRRGFAASHVQGLWQAIDKEAKFMSI